MTQMILARIDALDAKNDEREARTTNALEELTRCVKTQNGRIGRIEVRNATRDAVRQAVSDRVSWRFPAFVALATGLAVSVIGTLVAITLHGVW